MTTSEPSTVPSAFEASVTIATAMWVAYGHFAYAAAVMPFELYSLALTTRAQRAIQLVERSPFGGHEVVHASFGQNG